MLGTCAWQFPHPYNFRKVKLEHQVPGGVRGGSREKRQYANNSRAAFNTFSLFGRQYASSGGE
jgi:hypothetical protein